jgi:predicted aminopeptidase
MIAPRAGRSRRRVARQLNRRWMLRRAIGSLDYRAQFRSAARAAVLIALTVTAQGCELGYLARAALQEGHLLWNRRPISEQLARTDLSSEMREKLETVLEVRQFAARRLGLNVGGAYRTVSEVESGAIVWLVMAAPCCSLTPYTWWFPIVGNVPYHGYFDRSEADGEAAELAARGMDTWVRPAVAFSSLGFFDDPLLSNLLVLDKVELAGIITHELFHRTFFLAGNVMFDESAATYVGSRGAVDFFTATEGGESRDARLARSILQSDLMVAQFLLQAQAQLLRLYDSGLPEGEISKRRGAIFKQIAASYQRLRPSLTGLERFDLDQTSLNNAVLLNYLTYFHNLDDFAALDRIHRENLQETIEAIISLAKSEPGDAFDAIWRATHGVNPSKSAAKAQPAGLKSGAVLRAAK